MKCRWCQHENRPGAKFCDECGTPLAGTALEKPYAELKDENELLGHSLSEALQQQTATSGILRVISSSPTDIQPVFDAIAASAVRLCGARIATVFRFDGELIHLMAHHGYTPEALELRRGLFPAPPHAGSVTGRAIMNRAVVHIEDALADGTYPYQDFARAAEVRSVIAVPLLRDRCPIGAITASGAEPGAFAERQIELLQSFADQAVIAIENARLFKELEIRNRELTETLAQQAGTGEILRIISTSPTELQPVLEAVIKSAAQLCGAYDAAIFQLDGESLRVAAHQGPLPGTIGLLLPVALGTVAGRAVLERRAVHVADLPTEAKEFPEGSAFARELGYHTTLSVPLLRQGTAVGTIQLRRAEMNPFTDKQVALLQTFADQAVIAIENARLFKELRARNAGLTEALEQQTALGDILKAMTRSAFGLEPVLAAIIENAGRLCGADQGAIHQFDGEVLKLGAAYRTPPEYREYARGHPVRASRGSVSGRAAIDRRTVHIHDVLADPEYQMFERQRVAGFRTFLAVPMLKDQSVVGVINLWKMRVEPFTDQQIQLVQTFADQAVIAVENVRLFKELQARTQQLTRSVDELTALGDVGRALSSTLDLETVLETIVTRANTLAGTAGCVIWEYDKPREEFRLRVSHYANDTDATILPTSGGVTTIPRGQGLTTQVMEERQAVQIPDITVEGAYDSPVRKPLIDAGHRALLGVPLLSEDEVVGVLAVTRKTPGDFAPEIVRLLTTFATQSALAIQNARLFLEIEDKSHQLEVASQHKSEFLANMSHELRTPLNAIIGFAEVLGDRLFGELNDKQEEYLKDIHASGQHLLSLINDILDLSKVEAGRMELELSDFNLPVTLDNALTLVRERAGRHVIALHMSVDDQVEQVRADERKIRQVVLNLLSNAIKFTPDGGRIDVRAAPRDGAIEVSVADTGVGIAPEDQGAIFEEFRQVGTADKKVEGTGLGLALSRKFVELHGGRIWVKSQVGAGSTFTFTVPVRRGE